MSNRTRGLASAVGAAIVVSTLIHAQGPLQSAPQAPPPCPVSTDPEFGYRPDKAIRVGGGAAYVAAREQRYLQGLRGPNGQPISFKRSGSTGQQSQGGIVDVYAVMYEGLERPIVLYLNAYRYAEPAAPSGFQCVGFQLGPPPVDPFLGMDLQRRLAIEQGATRDFAPIPLSPDGSTTYGVAYDQFRLIARGAMAAAQAGKPWDPANPPSGIAQQYLTVVATPLSCGDRTVAPLAVDILPPQGPAVPRLAGPASGEELAKISPLIPAPPGSVGVIFNNMMTLRAQDRVRITYAEAICDGASNEVLLPVSFTPAKGVTMPDAPLPATATAPVEPMLLQAVVDLDGHLRRGQYIGGPEGLMPDALTNLALWRAEPARINRAPVVFDTLAAVRFK